MVGRWYISGPKLIPVYKKQCGQRLALLLASVRISYYGVSVVLLPYYILYRGVRRCGRYAPHPQQDLLF